MGGCCNRDKANENEVDKKAENNYSNPKTEENKNSQIPKEIEKEKPSEPKKSSQEDIIRYQEERSPFRKMDLQKIEVALKVHSYDYKLNHSNARSIFAELGMDPSKLTDPETTEYKYLEAIIDHDRLFSQRKVVLGAILISNSKISKKITLVQRYYEFPDKGDIEPEKISKFLEEVVFLSVKVVSVVAVSLNESDIKNKLSEDELESYSDQLMQGKEKFVKNFIDLIFQNKKSISAIEFNNKLNNAELSVLFSSQSVRQVLSSFI